MFEVSDLYAGYNSVPVLNGVSLSLHASQVLTLLGRNGAGKTTLMRVLAGLLPLTRGSVSLEGKAVSGKAADEIARQGVAYVPQGRGIFHKLTVHENLLIGTRAQGIPNAKIPPEVFEYFPMLAERRQQAAGTLSGGQQQQLAIGRALCGKPRVLLLDEPSEGIQPNIVQQIKELLRQITRATGVSVLLVEQNIDLGLGAADQCLVMHKGQITWRGLPQEFNDEKVIRHHLAV